MLERACRVGLIVAAAWLAVPGEDAAGADAAELECLALNIYWEARSESVEDQAAVAHVTLNRVASPDFPDTICDVVRQGEPELGSCQFSWWCDGAPDRPEDAEVWAETERTARDVLSGAIPDPTRGALYYHLDGITPDWAAGKERLTILGPHVFYR
jgi:spore germination cell wall hydrolase CwlJ-like protein